jgi:hypothetical protein
LGFWLRGLFLRPTEIPDPGGRNDENNFVIKGLSYLCACPSAFAGTADMETPPEPIVL